MTDDIRKRLLVLDALSLAAGEGIVQADGTLWSHAATLGTRVKGTQFSIDRKTVENFCRVFATGYPRKCPVDYEHGSTDDDAVVRAQRAMGKVPKAGDVVEMKGVFGTDDFTGTLKTAAEKLTASGGRPLEDERNLGLWIRWRPTQKALAAIQAREYTELSIAFDDNYPHNTTGEGQGPTLLAIALLNTPFLDDMLSVAASRHGGSPAAPGNGEERMTKLTLLAAAAAFLGKPVADEDQAITELQRLQPELTGLQKFRTDVLAATGETDPAKALTRVGEFKTQNEKFVIDLAAAKKAKIDGQITATMTKFEKRLTVPLKDVMSKQLRAELEAGTELEKTETYKALDSMKETGITTQSSAGDLGGAGTADEKKFEARVNEILGSNEEVKSLRTSKGELAAYNRAVDIAEAELEPAAR